MSPTPTDVGSSVNSQQTTALPAETTTPAVAPAPPLKEEPRLSAEAAAALGEDTSSVSSHGAPSSPRPGSAEPQQPPRPSLPPPISITTTGQHEAAAGGGSDDNLPSGISVQELKKATALRMANQQQAHLRVVGSFGYGKAVRARAGSCVRSSQQNEREREID